jgi:hypothetical protein
MKNLILISIFIIILISGCASGASEQEIQTAIAATNQAIPTSTSTITPDVKPTNTLPPTSTPRAVPTNIPSATPIIPSPTPTIPGPEAIFARNRIGTLESGGVIIEISRVLFADKNVIKEMGVNLDELEDYQGIDTVGEIIYTVINTTDKVVRVRPNRAILVINDEQIDLTNWWFGASFGDDIGDEIFPGVTTIGGGWFGVKRSTVPEINRLIVSIDAPFDSESYADLGEDYYFDLDISEHNWEEMPEDLK